ncbi:MAG: methyltransferase domain-containing protein [Deltaproteobacteria bacterium]|nr:methyltransferase domain-containing protein [Deltaproteobacteria bacterium]
MLKKKEKFEEYMTTESLFAPYSVWLAELCKIQKGMHVLDVGCGIGVSTFPLLDLIGPEGKIEGIDISAHLISRAERRATSLQISNAAFSVCNAEALDFPKSTFDCVMSSFTINQVSDKQKALSEMIRVLKPGGYLGFTIPGLDHYKEFFDIAAKFFKEDQFSQRKNKLLTELESYQSNLKNLGITEWEIFSKEKAYKIATVEEYDVILQTRGPKNAILLNIPEDQRAKVWQGILDQFVKIFDKDHWLHLTVTAQGLVFQKPFMDELQ